MSDNTFEFFLDFMSPTAYLAWTQLPGLLARTGASVVWRPMLTIEVQKLTGDRSPMAVPNKARWAIAEANPPRAPRLPATSVAN